MINDKDIADLEKLAKKDKSVSKLLQFYKDSVNDPTDKLRMELKQLTSVIADDIEKIRTDGEIVSASGDSNLLILGSNKDDKLFERVMLIIKQAPILYDAIRINDPEEEASNDKRHKKHEGKVAI